MKTNIFHLIDQYFLLIKKAKLCEKVNNIKIFIFKTKISIDMLLLVLLVHCNKVHFIVQ
jgi:hypothetical protein